MPPRIPGGRGPREGRRNRTASAARERSIGRASSRARSRACARAGPEANDTRDAADHLKTVLREHRVVVQRRHVATAEVRCRLSAAIRQLDQQQLGKELAAMGNSEMWQAGKATRALRPKEKAKKTTKATKGIAGRKSS